MSKARVVPLKMITVPRLELSPATASVRLDKMIKRELGMTVDRTFFRTDSTSFCIWSFGERVFSVTSTKKFWIIRTNSVVCNFLANCISCRRRLAPVCSQKMADLSEEGVPPDSLRSVMLGSTSLAHLWWSKEEVKWRGMALFSRVWRSDPSTSKSRTRLIQIPLQTLFAVSLREEASLCWWGLMVGPISSAGEKELRTCIQKWNRQRIREYLLQQLVRWIFNPPSSVAPRWYLGTVYKNYSQDPERSSQWTDPEWWRVADSHVRGGGGYKWSTHHEGFWRFQRLRSAFP